MNCPIRGVKLLIPNLKKLTAHYSVIMNYFHTKALDVIKVVANSKWGADKITLLHLHRSLVRSKLDYGCIVYGSARTSYLKAPDAIHHKALGCA